MGKVEECFSLHASGYQIQKYTTEYSLSIGAVLVDLSN